MFPTYNAPLSYPSSQCHWDSPSYDDRPSIVAALNDFPCDIGWAHQALERRSRPAHRLHDGAGSSSLDSVKNNRHTDAVFARPVGRGKYCGRMSVRGADPKTGATVYRRVNCGAWGCSYCGPRKARTAQHAIRTIAAGLGLSYFLTLTLDPKQVPNKKMQIPYPSP